jgi:vacuolar-type H+-ATPase subunit F/Vma7
MARLVVVTNSSLADGFRLAGADAVVATSGADAAATLRALAGSVNAGVVLVTDDLWEGIPPRLRATLEHLAQPIVLGVPAGSGFDAGGRVQIVEMLERALGYRIQSSGREVP